MAEFTFLGTVARDFETGSAALGRIASDLYACSDCGCVVVDREAHAHPMVVRFVDPAQSEAPAVEGEGSEQLPTNERKRNP